MQHWRAWLEKHLTTQNLHPLQKVAVVGILVLVGLSVSIGGVSRIVQEQVEYILSAVLPGVIVELTNEEREAQDLGTLRRSPILDEAARLKAEHMRKEEYFAHYSPKGNVSPWHWFDEVEYDYVHAGENLAVYFDDSEDVVEAWMDSPLHRDNILKSQYTEIGVAAVKGEYQGYDTVYVVQLFGTPARVPQPAPTPASTPALATVSTPQQPAVIPAPIVPEEPETVEIAEEPEGEPEALAIAPEATPEEEPVLLADTAVVEKEEPATTTNVSMVTMSTGGVALVSDHMATTTPKIPAQDIRAAGTTLSAYVPTRNAFAAHDTLQVYYFVIALLVALSLIMSVFITLWRHAHAQAWYGTGLLLLLLGIVALHVEVVEAAIVATL